MMGLSADVRLCPRADELSLVDTLQSTEFGRESL